MGIVLSFWRVGVRCQSLRWQRREADLVWDEVLWPGCRQRWCVDLPRQFGFGVATQTGASTAAMATNGGQGVPGKTLTVLVLEASMNRSGRGDRFGIEGSGWTPAQEVVRVAGVRSVG